ncbi:MAG: tetratricopeptide repeat protein [Planctomycetes bacterium]|nr:tetratricopeptide repeat protein [Planctomycetota bacterium]
MARKMILFMSLMFLLVSVCAAQKITKRKDKANFGMAQSLNNLGKYEQAQEKLNDLYDRYPDNKNVAIELVKALGYGKKFDQASNILNKLQTKYPHDIKIQRLYANIAEANQQFKLAITHYIKLLEHEPSDNNIKMKIADISSWIADYETSINYYRQILEKQPADKRLKAKMADVYFWMGNYTDAIRFYKEIGIGTKNKERFKNLGYAYLNAKLFDNAIDVFRQLTRHYPNDINLRVALANALYASGDMDNAKKIFKEVIERAPKDTQSALKLAEILAAKQHYQEAINICEQVLQDQPDNKDATLRLARIYSWYRGYEKSLAIYDEIIRTYPDWLQPRREKARVLGWTRRYNDSIKEYEKTINEIDPNQVVNYEMQAKYNFYNLYDSGAIEYFKKWLMIEPKNLEALFDIAQLYSRQMRWSNAVNAYKQVLKISPEHLRAKQALKKVNLYAQKTTLKTGFQYAEAKSQSRDVDYRYWNTFVSAKKPLNENYYLTLQQDNTWFNFKRFKQVYQQRFLVALDYYSKPNLWASANYAHSFFREETGVKDTFGAEMNYKPTDPWTLSISQQREPMIDNISTLDDRLYRDNYKLVSRYRHSRRLLLRQHVIFSHYSDDNDRNAYGVDLDYYLYYEPTSLKITYRYEEYHFNAQRTNYFTPKSFHYNTVALEFRNFLNKEELFFGANDTFYTIRYAVNFDVQNEIGHEIYIDFHHDYSDTLAMHIQVEKKIYEHGDTYRKDRVMFYLKMLF